MTMLGFSGTPAKRHLNGVSLASQWWSAYSGVWILSLMIRQSRTPLTKLSESAHATGQLCFRAKRPPRATQLLKQQQHVAWKRWLWSWTSCCPWDFDYVPLSAADNISRQDGPRSFNVFINKKGTDIVFPEALLEKRCAMPFSCSAMPLFPVFPNGSRTVGHFR